MPEIIVGRAYSNRDQLFYDRIAGAAQNGNVLVIVPDQFSFQMDKILYDVLGAQLFNKIETRGIKAEGEEICRTLGGSTLSNADDNQKLIAMYRAQSKLRHEGVLSYYKKSLLKPAFVSECMTLISQLIHAGATPQTLKIASEASLERAPRLHDISEIYASYNEQLADMGLRDSLSQMAQAARLAKEHKFFEGKQVFFDGFTSLSADELELVESVISSSKRTTISLIMDDVNNGANPFASTQRMLSKIERISNDSGRAVKITRAVGNIQSKPLAHINEEYFAYSPAKINSQGMVKVIAADDIYIESDYVCSEILRLVREEGMRFNDIAVMCGGLEETARVLGSTAQRYEIPYFVDKVETSLTSVPARYLIAILNAALTRKYNTENILRIVKSPLSPFFDFDACDLEDFCIRWKVEGDMWKSPFVIEALTNQNARVEQTRLAIIEPLERFKAACDDATAGEICEALFKLLDDLSMSDQIYSAVKRASNDNETDFEVSRGFKQVWLAIVEAIKSIYENMGEQRITLRTFSELLQLMLSAIKMSSPPQKSDCVMLLDAERSRVSGVKALFIMQCNDGVFPKGIKHSKLLNESDITALSEQGAEIEISARNQLDNERMNCYYALTAAKDRLYISYAEADRSGSVISPSQLPAAIGALFSDELLTKTSETELEFFCTSYRTAFYNYLEHSKDKTQAAANVKDSLLGSNDYTQRLEYVKAAAADKDEKLSNNMAKSIFFPRDLNLSATRVSDFYKCPFSYFCKYGLKLYPTDTVEMNAMYIGNIAHSCLERVMSTVQNDKRVYNPSFTSMTDEQLIELIDESTNDYINEQMGGSYGKTLSFKFAVERLKKSILGMVINFREELKDSLFLPIAFEYDLTDSDGNPIFAIEINDDDIDLHTRLNLRGKIDRADIYRTNQGSWLRIVDYKTGKQTFNMAEVYHGLDLQMLIYLLAVTISGKLESTSDEELKSAGIMYSHVKFVPPSLTAEQVKELEASGELDEQLRLERAKIYKPEGVMIGDEIMPALNKSHDGVYTIFKFKKDGSVSGTTKIPPVSVQELTALELFAFHKIEEMSKRLGSGEIKADPIQTDSGIACTYCDYKAVCKNANPLNPRAVTPDDEQLLKAELERIVKGE
ncbi:MAG: PD-(D/E)XK nuclease family protein [Ruminococcus sp.]|nr:PD-(D/E)XK nuclease family protein [Ruminococcus sp.]